MWAPDGMLIEPTKQGRTITKLAAYTGFCVVSWGLTWSPTVEQKRNVMAHAQKPDLVFQRNGRVHLHRRGCQVSRLLAAEVCASAVVMLDRPCPIQCKTAGYPLHLPFSPSLLHPCVSVCHQIPFLLVISLIPRPLYTWRKSPRDPVCGRLSGPHA